MGFFCLKSWNNVTKCCSFRDWKMGSCFAYIESGENLAKVFRRTAWSEGSQICCNLNSVEKGPDIWSSLKCAQLLPKSDNWYKGMPIIKCYNYKFLFQFEVISTFTQKVVPCDIPTVCSHSPYHSYLKVFPHEVCNQWIPNHRMVLFIFIFFPASSNGNKSVFSYFCQKQGVTHGYSFLVCVVPLGSCSALQQW